MENEAATTAVSTVSPELLELITSILWGKFIDSDIALQSWIPLRSKLLIFVSSTFTDTHAERNVLLESVLPDIRLEGSKYGVDVTFVDMRWGVRDENTLDHGTWDECVRELDRCHEESAGIFFLSLQADKYGYVPLPRTVDKEALDVRKKSMSIEELNLAEAWYRLDENSIPAKYVLRNLKDLRDRDYWDVVLPVLRKELNGLVFDKQQFPLLRIGQSVTHWEALTGLEKLKSEQHDGISRFIWEHRHFRDFVTLAVDPRKY
jgi:hypothetical protein